jgi:hypothetical protein
MEDQALRCRVDLAPFLPFFLFSKLSLFLSLPCVWPELTDGRGEGGGGGAKSYDGRESLVL